MDELLDMGSGLNVEFREMQTVRRKKRMFYLRKQRAFKGTKGEDSTTA